MTTEEAYATMLAGLPGVGPARLRALVGGRLPSAAFAWITDGDLADDPAVRAACGRDMEQLSEMWKAVVGRGDPDAAGAAIAAAGIRATWWGSADYPPALSSDAEAPAILFWVGDPVALDRPRVTIVGTRASTPLGAEVARDLGADLAEAGVAVVSGLALGIDGAAHRGALEGAGRGGAPPVGVVASGLDMPYPRRHASLWREVAESGVLLSETAPGRRPDLWRFPARNRILAALANVVVVVESHAGGGSLLTVEEALRRGIDIMAVPGSVRSPASAGPNALLADGAAPVRSAADVLDFLGLQHRVATPAAAARRRLGPDERSVLDAVDWTPTGTSRVVAASGLGVVEVARCLYRLEILGLVRRGPGWWERRAPPAGGTPG